MRRATTSTRASTTRVVNYTSNFLLLERSLISISGCKFPLPIAVFCSQFTFHPHRCKGNWTTRGYANSRTGHLEDWSTGGLDNSRTIQLADWTTRGLAKRTTRRPASTDRTARHQFQATGQPVSRTQASDAMTKWLPRYEAECAQCRCLQCRSVPSRSDIKAMELPPTNILIPLERQLIALQLCRRNFLYNETFQHFSSFIVKIVQKTTNLRNLSPF